MNIYRTEITGTGALAHTALPFNAKFLKLRHIAGAVDASISFNGSTDVAMILSPSGGTYSQDVTMEAGAVSQIGVNAAVTVKVEVIAWL